MHFRQGSGQPGIWSYFGQDTPAMLGNPILVNNFLYRDGDGKPAQQL